MSSLPYTDTRYTITNKHGQIVVTLDNGVAVYYNGNADGKVCVPETCKGTLTGICGNFDGNSLNDLRTSTGRLLNSGTGASGNQIGESWKVQPK